MKCPPRGYAVFGAFKVSYSKAAPSGTDLQEYIQENKPRIKKMIVGSFSALASSVKAWNNEEKRLYVNIA